MKCRWYAERYNGKCFNGSCPYRGDTCPTSEHPEACRYAEAKQEPELNAEELATALRNCASEEGECKNCPYLHLFESGICCDDCLKQKAADMLEKLAAEKGEKKPEWISVKDRPPEEAEPVNVTWVNHRPAPYYSKIKNVEQTATAVYFGGKWYWYSNVCVDMLEEYGRNAVDLLDENIEITHWMPLPKPMKEEER
jgi:hypothetical protein|nr:MAG TPA_asm: Protein of unknown function (DUF551) [Caudoviricetes sp.]